MSLTGRVAKKWQTYSLATQFTMAASIAVVGCMAVLGAWVSARIEDGVLQNSAITTAFYMESLLAPLLQPLASEPKMPDSVQHALTRILTGTPLGRQIATIKIWAPPPRRPSLTRTVLYSNIPDLIGKTFEQSAEFKKAASGLVVTHLGPRDQDEDRSEKILGIPLLEIYAPIYEHGTSRVIAIAEFYQRTDALWSNISATRERTFLIVGGSTVAMLAVLFDIVRQGSRTIAAQRIFLEQRVGDLSEALTRNEELRQILRDSRRRSVETNELLMRRIGAELHDGPGQLVGLALMRLDALLPTDADPSKEAKTEIYEIIRGALVDSIDEIRGISSGIAPPHLRANTLKIALELAVRNYEKRTGTPVACDIDDFPQTIPSVLKTCLYRFTQEGLTNGYKHAAGVGQKVTAKFNDGTVTVEVSDAGSGASSVNVLASSGLGLAGLRDRVEALDGKFEFISTVGQGTRIVAQFVLNRSFAYD